MTVITTRLQRWESKAEWGLAACALVFLVLYSIEVLALPSGRPAHVISILLFILYLPFTRWTLPW